MRPSRRLLSLTCFLLISGCASAGSRPIPQPAPEPEVVPAEVAPVPSEDVRPDPLAFDLIIENGRIVDGTGAGWFYGDVGIRGDRIDAVVPRGMLRFESTRQRIDAQGHVVAPGFIDIQGHSRFAFLEGDGRVVSKVSQGITTEILGEGTTNAPVNPESLGPVENDDTPAERLNRRMAGDHGFDAWLTAMERHGVSSNVGSFVGASTVRTYGAGSRMGAATARELAAMQLVVRQAMQDGAFGLASALIYPPGNFASTEELGQIAAAMAPYGGVYITHMRSEGDQFLEAIDEAIEIGNRGGVPVEIYHLKAGGQRNWPKARLAVAKIDSARAAGVDVQANMYPYTAGSTGLTACFPPWASADGKLFVNLADGEARARMREEMESETVPWENLCGLATAEGVLILGVEKSENRKYSGMRLSEVAEDMGKDWVDAAFDLVLSERQRVGSVYFLMSEENVRMQLQAPWMKFGTDAGGVNPETTTVLVHPRSYGTFPRILGKYVRDEGVIPLEDAIRKMTSAVADRLSIRDRGLVKQGFRADIVIFDPETVGDVATYEDPHQPSVGIRDVFVNGIGVIRNGRHTGAKPGRVVRGPGWTGWRPLTF